MSNVQPNSLFKNVESQFGIAENLTKDCVFTV